jgi:hypothetical protein
VYSQRRSAASDRRTFRTTFRETLTSRRVASIVLPRFGEASDKSSPPSPKIHQPNPTGKAGRSGPRQGGQDRKGGARPLTCDPDGTTIAKPAPAKVRRRSACTASRRWAKQTMCCTGVIFVSIRSVFGTAARRGIHAYPYSRHSARRISAPGGLSRYILTATRGLSGITSPGGWAYGIGSNDFSTGLPILP